MQMQTEGRLLYRGPSCTLPTYSMDQSPSWEADRSSPSQEIAHIL